MKLEPSVLAMAITVLVVLAALGCALDLTADDGLAPLFPEARFTNLSTVEGLSHNSVYAIVQDQTGFLWFATEAGLNRYDGTTVVVEQHDPRNPATLAESDLNTIFEDRSGMVWVGTWGGGLDRYDPTTGAIDHFANRAGDPTSISGNRIKAILDDESGKLWVGTFDSGLCRLDPATEIFRSFTTADGLCDDHIWSLALDLEGDLWIGTEKGLSHFVPSSGSMYCLAEGDGVVAELLKGRIRHLFADASGRLWIGTESGVQRIDLVNRDIESLSWPGGLSGKTCTALLGDVRGRIWIGTEDDGLFVHDPQTNAWQQYRRDPNHPASLSHDDVRALALDRSGNLWIGTRGGGVDRLDLKPIRFYKHGGGSSAQPRLHETSVWSIIEDSDGIVWIGTDGGLSRWDRAAGTSTLVAADPAAVRSGATRVRSLVEDGLGQLWVGSEAGIRLLDRNTGVALPEARQISSLLPRDLGQALKMVESDDGRLWVGTDGTGLIVIDSDRKQVTQLRHDPEDDTSLGGDRVVAILEDRQSRMWIGSDGGGLSLINEDGTFRRFERDWVASGSLSNNHVLGLLEDRRGRLWIGTRGGLNLMDHQSEVFRVLTEDDGLPNNTVYGILEDHQGFLWLTTDRGLARLDPESLTIRTFSSEPGLEGTGFNEGAAAIGVDGDILVGGTHGFNVFSPGAIVDNPEPPPVVVTSISTFDRTIETPLTPWAVERVELAVGESGLTFRFAALDYTAPELNRYAYQLVGHDEQWIEVGHRRTVTYSRLEPGSYVFRVKGSNSDSVWNDDGVSIEVLVPPPVWQTWWFRLMVLVSLLVVAVAVHRLRIRAIELHNQELRQMVSRCQVAEDQVRRYADELEHAVLFDPLTELPNRLLLTDRIELALSRCRRDEVCFAVLQLGIDRFRLVNESLGPASGDDLLSMIALRLTETARESDLVARIGSDQFAVLIADVVGVADAGRAAAGIHSAFAEPFNLRGEQIYLTVSIGIAMGESTVLNHNQILREADAAMHRAKAAGLGQQAVFDPEMHAQAVEQLELEGDLRRAVSGDELVLHYQPIIDLKSRLPVGFEALIRWQHESKGLISPADFLPVIERMGMEGQVGAMVLDAACQQLSLWNGAGARQPRVSINLFVSQVSDVKLVDQVGQALQRYNLEPDRLRLEITENALIEEPEAAMEVISSLRRLGVKVYLDDFGTGFSSLSYLQRFPVDALKIDRSFVSRLGTSSESDKIVSATILLAQSLGLEAIAEGIETEEQLEHLVALGCDYGQGYHFSRPVPPTAAHELFQSAH